MWNFRVIPFILLLAFGHMAAISGFIRNEENGEPIPFTSVLLEGTGIGTSADIHGYFVLPNVPDGEYRMQVTMIGFGVHTRTIRMENKDLRIDISLSAKALTGEMVEISGERARFKAEPNVSNFRLTAEELQMAPAFIEDDVFRTFQLLPGVTSQNDFSAALIVRGGSPDENLVLLDSPQIYNPYHVGGIFSTFNADAISNAEFMSGGFQAEYGGHLSSVIQLTTREGDSKNGRLSDDNPFKKYVDFSGLDGEISLLSSKVLIEGPSYNGSWFFSGRRTYFDQLARLYYSVTEQDQNWDYYFWDTQFKIHSNLAPDHRLTYTRYSGLDDLFINVGGGDLPEIDFRWKWGNRTQSLDWRYIPSSRLFFETTLSSAKYFFDVRFQFTVTRESTFTDSAESSGFQLDMTNLVNDRTLSHRINWFPSSRHSVIAGVELKTLTLKYQEEFAGSTIMNWDQSPRIFAAFVRDTWRPAEAVILEAGVRISKYELYRKYIVDPRLNIKYFINENLALKGSWGLYSQFLFTINQDDQLLRIVDFWQPILEGYEPQRVQHFILGMEYLSSGDFSATVEWYYKPYSNILDLSRIYHPADGQKGFVEGTAEASGIEILLKKNRGRLRGWVGYSYSVVEKTVDYNENGIIEAELGESFRANYDMPHNFKATFSYRLSPRRMFTVSCNAHSGQPFTPPLGKVFHQDNNIFGSVENPYQRLDSYYGQKNSARYPAYFRVDVGFSQKGTLFGQEAEYRLQVINLTNYYNVLLYNWDLEASPAKVSAYSMFPVILTFGVEFKL